MKDERKEMRAVLFSTNNEILEMLDNPKLAEEKVNIVGLCDRDTSLWGEEKNGQRIISPFEMLKLYRNKELDKIILPGATKNELERRKMFFLINGLGIAEEDILFGTVELFHKSSQGPYFLKWKELRYFDYLELHTCDHCNLKCHNCNNFANYVEGERYYEYDTFFKDSERLKKLISHISLIRVLGGEPLLNPDTYKYIKRLRELYPYAEITMVTNGILLPNASEILWQTIRETNAMVDLTAYPILYDKIDERIALLNSKKVRHRNPFIASKFFPPIIERYEYPLSYVDCMCVNLRDGYLTRCPMQQYIADYNKANGTEFDVLAGKINIYQIESFEKLINRLHKPFELCNYCGMWRQNELWEKWEM